MGRVTSQGGTLTLSGEVMGIGVPGALAVGGGVASDGSNSIYYLTLSASVSASALPIDVSFDYVVLEPGKTMSDFKGTSYTISHSNQAEIGVLMSWNSDTNRYEKLGMLYGFKTNFDTSLTAAYTFEVNPQQISTELYNGTAAFPIGFLQWLRSQGAPGLDFLGNIKCFLAGTQITMADGTTKPIEEIVPGNLVMAFDEHANNGMRALVPRKVTRTLPGISKDIIELRGLRVTPGHRFLSDYGEWVAIADCLIEDRAIVEERDGGPVYIRARTGAVVGSPQDVPLLVVFNDPSTLKPRGALIRAGVPCMGEKIGDNKYELWDLARLLDFNGYKVLPTGHVIDPQGVERDSVWWPDYGTPLSTALQQDWIVKLDGQRFMPQWIADIAALDKEGRQTVNGQMRVHKQGGGSVQSLPRMGKSSAFAPTIVGGGASADAMNRKSRRKQAALTRVK
jgi:hypothetical protein